MGASGWSYFVPYQQEINKALKELKDEVFEKGRYERPLDVNPNQAERDLNYLTSLYASLPDEVRKQTDQFLELARSAAKRQRPARMANSIDELLEQCRENGTHSILDIEKVSSVPGFGVITPLSNEHLINIFRTDKPTHEMVAIWSNRVDPPTAKPFYERWQGVYVIVYEDNKPTEIYFEGASGD
jgi:hypothetical protein